MPHVEKSSYPSEPDSSEPQLKKLRPNDYVPWRAHDTRRRKEHCTTPTHDNNFPPIPGKYSFEHKYGRDGSISSEYPRTATDRLAPKSAEKFDSDWRAYSRPSAGRPEGISPHTSGRASSSEDGYQVSCSVSTSGSEFSLTSTAFIGPLCPPPRTEKVPRSSHVKDRPIAGTTSNCCKISTVELGKGPGRSKGNDGMDYELRQFYMELHQLEEENENTPVKTNEHHSSNAVQERPCSSDPPKSITVCSQEVYGVIPHPNHAPFSRREEHIPNNANNLPFINPAMPPRFSGPLARPLTLSHGHQSQNGAIKNIEYKFSDVVQGPFCTQRPSNCVSPHPQSFNAETVWRAHNPSDRANNPPYTNNTVPPWFHGPPPAVYHSKSNFPSPDIKPYETYPEKPNRYGCTEEYRRQDDRQQWNELPPPPQNKYNDPGDGFRKTFYDDESVSQHIDLRGESTPRPRETLLPHTPGTSGEQHVDVNKNSSHKPCDQYRRTLILLRGVPGSGKSTLARVLLDLCPDGLAFSTDDYFSQQEGYVYNVTLLGDAHNWNQNRAKRAMDDGRYPIIIDNTNIQGWEMKPYVQMAIERDYVVEFLEPDTWWKLNPLELEKRNKHGVPCNTISKMLDRYEHYMTVPHVMNSVEPPRLSSSRRAPHPRQQWGNSVDSLQQQTIFHNR